MSESQPLQWIKIVIDASAPRDLMTVHPDIYEMLKGSSPSALVPVPQGPRIFKGKTPPRNAIEGDTWIKNERNMLGHALDDFSVYRFRGGLWCFEGDIKPWQVEASIKSGAKMIRTDGQVL